MASDFFSCCLVTTSSNLGSEVIKMQFLVNPSCWWLSLLQVLSHLGFSTSLWSHINNELIWCSGRLSHLPEYANRQGLTKVAPGCLRPQSKILAAAILPVHALRVPTVSVKGNIDKGKRKFTRSFVHTFFHPSTHVCLCLYQVPGKPTRKSLPSYVCTWVCVYQAPWNRKSSSQPWKDGEDGKVYQLI